MPQKPEPHLFCFLTQPEWKLCFSLVFCVDFFDEESYPLAQYSSPEHPGDTWEELFRRAIRFLALEHNFEFRGVHVNREGIVVEHTVVQPENALYATQAKAGQLPGNPRYALAEAVQMIEQLPIPSLDPEPLRACLAATEQQVQELRAKVDPDKMRKRYENDQKALASIGVRPIKEVVH